MDYENAPPRGPEPSDPKLREIFRYKNDSHVLLEVASNPSDSPRHAAPPMIRLEAGRISPSKPVTAADMLAFIKQTESERSNKVIREPEDSSFDGQVFSRMDVSKTGPTTKLEFRTTYWSYVVGTRKGYILIFAIVANSPEELDRLFETLRSPRFASL